MPSPVAPWKGAPLRVIFTAEKPLDGEFSLVGPDGKVAAKSHDRHGGPPYFWYAEVATPAAGTWHATLARTGAPADCATLSRDIAVRPTEPPRPHAEGGSLWPIRAAWDRSTENLYSAWIEKLFDAPGDQAPTWKALHEVLRDKSRNALYDHLGLKEDQAGLILKPDCADMPYFLRAYFAFKIGLPFGYSKCTRGTGGEAPTCFAWWNIQNLEPRPAPPDPVPTPQLMAAAGDEMPATRGLLDMFRQPGAAPAGAAPAGRDRLRRPRRGVRPRGRRGLPRPSATICARTSPTASIPAPAAPPRPTTTPTTIRCR